MTEESQTYGSDIAGLSQAANAAELPLRENDRGVTPAAPEGEKPPETFKNYREAGKHLAAEWKARQEDDAARRELRDEAPVQRESWVNDEGQRQAQERVEYYANAARQTHAAATDYQARAATELCTVYPQLAPYVHGDAAVLDQAISAILPHDQQAAVYDWVQNIRAEVGRLAGERIETVEQAKLGIKEGNRLALRQWAESRPALTKGKNLQRLDAEMTQFARKKFGDEVVDQALEGWRSVTAKDLDDIYREMEADKHRQARARVKQQARRSVQKSEGPLSLKQATAEYLTRR
jgi:hypothetical protein